MFGKLLSPLLLLLSLIGPATAAPMQTVSDTVNISGHWTFSARIQETCTFGGTAQLSQNSAESYVVELTARQSCDYLDEDFLVRQDCQATRLGQQLSIRCTIREFLNGYASPSYFPDNFTLTIASPNRMHGALVSAGGFQPAEWTRSNGGIS